MNFKDKLSPRQRKILADIHAMVQGFYEGNDNTLTYNLTGLLSEITQEGYVDARYLREKLDLVLENSPSLGERMDIRLWCYGPYEGHYGVHSMAVDLGDFRLYFSYGTIVAFEEKGRLRISENLWGPTTGKHLNAINPDKKVRLERAGFEIQLAEALQRRGITV